MLRGIYTAGTGMLTQQDRIDVLGNNLSNINTTGFKQDDMELDSFNAELVSRMADGSPVGASAFGVADGPIYTDFTPGNYEQTNQNTDLAILGGGFFPVQDAAGNLKYTRAGNFTVDAAGDLALPGGEVLLGSNGAPIRVGGYDFTVASDGTVTTAQGAVGQIAVYNGMVAKRNDGFYNLAGPVAVQTQLRQGWLEGSNVNAVTQVTQMMDSTRSFQANQQAFKIADDTLAKLVNSVGSLK